MRIKKIIIDNKENNNTGSQIKTLTSLSRIKKKKKIQYSHGIRFSCLSRASFKYSDRSGSLNFGAILIYLKNEIRRCCGKAFVITNYYDTLL